MKDWWYERRECPPLSQVKNHLLAGPFSDGKQDGQDPSMTVKNKALGCCGCSGHDPDRSVERNSPLVLQLPVVTRPFSLT